MTMFNYTIDWQVVWLVAIPVALLYLVAFSLCVVWGKREKREKQARDRTMMEREYYDTDPTLGDKND
jgi:hypothetical protein